MAIFIFVVIKCQSLKSWRAIFKWGTQMSFCFIKFCNCDLLQHLLYKVAGYPLFGDCALKWMRDSCYCIVRICNWGVSFLSRYNGYYAICVVSCSDGMGRTGTFLCIHAQLERVKSEGLVDFFQFVKSSRIHRPSIISEKVRIQSPLVTEAHYIDSQQKCKDMANLVVLLICTNSYCLSY